MTTRASEASATPLRRRPLDEAIAGARADDDAAWYCRLIASRTLPASEFADGSQALAELAMSRIDPTRTRGGCSGLGLVGEDEACATFDSAMTAE